MAQKRHVHNLIAVALFDNHADAQFSIWLKKEKGPHGPFELMPLETR